VEQIRDQLLAGPRLALDQRGERRVGVLADLALQLLQGRALADQRIGLGDALPGDLGGAELERVEQDLLEVLGIAGLGDELGGAQRARVPCVGGVVLSR